MCNMIFALHYNCTNIESYGEQVVSKNIKRHTSHIIGSKAYLLESAIRRQKSL